MSLLRIVNTLEHEKLAMNKPETSTLSSKITNDTWEMRYNKLKSETGFDTGRNKLYCMSIKNWLEELNLAEDEKISLFMEGRYVHNSIAKQELYLNFDKLKNLAYVQQPISFFAIYPTENDDIHLLFNALKHARYHLETKPHYSQTKPSQVPIVTSIMPEMIVHIMAKVYQDTPLIKHILFTVYNNDLIPLFTHLRSLNITLTLAISKSQPVNNYYLNKFNHIIDLVDLAQSAQALGHKKVKEKQHEF